MFNSFDVRVGVCVYYKYINYIPVSYANKKTTENNIYFFMCVGFV